MRRYAPYGSNYHKEGMTNDPAAQTEKRDKKKIRQVRVLGCIFTYGDLTGYMHRSQLQHKELKKEARDLQESGDDTLETDDSAYRLRRVSD